jgi:hypothetical protein
MPSSARAEEKRSRNAAAKVVNRFMSIEVDLKVLDLNSNNQRAVLGSAFQSVVPMSRSMRA